MRMPGTGEGAPSSAGGMAPPSPSTPYFCWSLRHLRGAPYIIPEDESRRRASSSHETAQNRKRDHPPPALPETTRLDGVKAPLHDGTPRSHRQQARVLVAEPVFFIGQLRAAEKER